VRKLNLCTACETLDCHRGEHENSSPPRYCNVEATQRGIYYNICIRFTLCSRVNTLKNWREYHNCNPLLRGYRTDVPYLFLLLLLRSGRIRRPLYCDHFWYIVRHISLLISPVSSTTALWQLPAERNNSKVGETWREMAVEFCLRSISFIFVCFLRAVKSYDMGPTALLTITTKLCYGFLSPLKIHRPQPGLNPRILGLMTSTTTPPRATICD
jgi:hypothetical protein